MNVCGIDVSKDTLDIVVRKKGKSLKCKTFSNDFKGHQALITYLKSHQVVRCALEATGYYHFDIAMLLSEEKKREIMVLNPRAAHNFAKAMMQQNKTDAIDAELLAQFVDRMDFISWTAPPHEVFALRACGRLLISLTKSKTRAKNRLHAFSTTKCTPAFIIDDLKLEIEQLEGRIENLMSHALELIKNNALLQSQYELLIGIKGIADRTVIKLLGEIGVLDSTMSAKQWVAHAGLYPKVFQSGSSVMKKARIGKAGNRYIREALYMGALSAARHEPHLKGFYQHLILDNGLTKLQALCAVMRKILIAIHAMLKTEKCFDGSHLYQLASH